MRGIDGFVHVVDGASMCIEEFPTAEIPRVRIFREMVKLSERNKLRKKKTKAQGCPDCRGSGKDPRGKDCNSCAGTGTATDWR